jgi:ABC-type transport system substrate-binding protein
MAESPDHAAGDGEEAANETAEAHVVNLPVVAAPKLSGADNEEEDGAQDKAHDKAADEVAAPAAPTHSRRFLVLAATLAFAAAFGSFVGSVSGSGLVRFIYPPRPAPGMENTIQAMQELKAELAAIGDIKANLESAARNTTSQYAKIADRLDQLDQRTAPAADITGSLASAAPPDESPKPTALILQDWIVDDVQNGRALVESRSGGIFDVGAGSILPGVGRVDTIKRQDGHWVVLTARGTITSGR